jgi:hypothetical protein
MADEWNSRVDVLYVYERLHDALDCDDLARKISDLSSEMAHNFKAKTGVTVGVALGWDTQARSVRAGGALIELTDSEVIELAAKTFPEKTNELAAYLAGWRDDGYPMDFDLDTWREDIAQQGLSAQAVVALSLLLKESN